MPQKRQTLPVKFPNGAVIQAEVDEQGYVVIERLGSFSMRQLLEGAGLSKDAAKEVVDSLFGTLR